MLQAVTTLLFSMLALFAFGVIAGALLRDWDMVMRALGHARSMPAPLPARMRRLPARRATMLRVTLPEPRRAAA